MLFLLSYNIKKILTENYDEWNIADRHETQIVYMGYRSEG